MSGVKAWLGGVGMVVVLQGCNLLVVGGGYEQHLGPPMEGGAGRFYATGEGPITDNALGSLQFDYQVAGPRSRWGLGIGAGWRPDEFPLMIRGLMVTGMASAPSKEPDLENPAVMVEKDVTLVSFGLELDLVFRLPLGDADIPFFAEAGVRSGVHAATPDGNHWLVDGVVGAFLGLGFGFTD